MHKICKHIYKCIYICIYIYIERERERDRNGEEGRERGRERDLFLETLGKYIWWLDSVSETRKNYNFIVTLEVVILVRHIYLEVFFSQHFELRQTC